MLHSFPLTELLFFLLGALGVVFDPGFHFHGEQSQTW